MEEPSSSPEMRPTGESLAEEMGGIAWGLGRAPGLEPDLSHDGGCGDVSYEGERLLDLRGSLPGIVNEEKPGKA